MDDGKLLYNMGTQCSALWQRRGMGWSGGLEGRLKRKGAYVYLLLTYIAVLRCMRAKLLQLCLTLCDPMDYSLPLSMGFSRLEYWSGLPCPPPGDLPHQGIQPVSLMSPALAGMFFTVWVIREPLYVSLYILLLSHLKVNYRCKDISCLNTSVCIFRN